MEYITKQLATNIDYPAPDSSQIRLLPSMERGGLAHCTLDPTFTSHAVVHKTVEEIWFFLEGKGQVWRKQGEREEVVDVYPNLSLTIPTGTHFQFRNTGDVPLCLIIVTMPPWPGPEEAVPVSGKW